MRGILKAHENLILRILFVAFTHFSLFHDWNAERSPNNRWWTLLGYLSVLSVALSLGRQRQLRLGRWIRFKCHRCEILKLFSRFVQRKTFSDGASRRFLPAEVRKHEGSDIALRRPRCHGVFLQNFQPESRVRRDVWASQHHHQARDVSDLHAAARSAGFDADQHAWILCVQRQSDDTAVSRGCDVARFLRSHRDFTWSGKEQIIN